jgi:hypothetical protein
MYLHSIYEDDMATNHQKILRVTQGFKKNASCTFHPSIIIWVKFSAEDFNMMFCNVMNSAKISTVQAILYLSPEIKFSPYFLHTSSHLDKIQ